MFVKSLEMINTKSFSHAKIVFSKGINLLLGANNSGKSVVIKALSNLQYKAFTKKDIRSTEDFSKVFIEIHNIQKNELSRFNIDDIGSNFITPSDVLIYWGEFRNASVAEENFMYDINNVKIDSTIGYKLIRKSKSGVLVNAKFTRFPESEEKNNFIYPFLARRKIQNYNSTLNSVETYRVAETFINLTAKIQKITNASHPMNEKFRELCQKILGFNIGIISADHNMNSSEAGIYTDSTSTISVSSMGEGVVNILGLIVILLTENNKLYLIEEIENDIHPTALKHLLDLILSKANNNQFIISTHSHIVLKYLGANIENKLFYLDWQSSSPLKKGSENVPTSSITEIENTPFARMKILEMLGYEYFDFDLFSAYLILEESTAEKIIRDLLIPNFTPKLYLKLKTIAVNGTSDLAPRFIEFHRLFVFIHTSEIYKYKAWVIADGDESGIKCIDGLKQKFIDWPESHFRTFSEHNFELYYPERFQSEVQRILVLKSKSEKQEAKRSLFLKVVKWSTAHIDLALEEFKISAKEVIDILKEIEKKIK